MSSESSLSNHVFAADFLFPSLACFHRKCVVARISNSSSTHRQRTLQPVVVSTSSSSTCCWMHPFNALSLRPFNALSTRLFLFNGLLTRPSMCRQMHLFNALLLRPLNACSKPFGPRPGVSTLVEEEACRLWLEKKWLIEDKRRCCSWIKMRIIRLKNDSNWRSTAGLRKVVIVDT
jgi:hypothetical protein